jgi:hypothetical protein
MNIISVTTQWWHCYGEVLLLNLTETANYKQVYVYVMWVDGWIALSFLFCTCIYNNLYVFSWITGITPEGHGSL